MFKRVDKKRKKRAEEEETGLDQDIKDIIGLNDTDSDESASDSDASSDAESDDLVEEEEDAADDDDDDDDDETPPISLPEALRDPVYVVSLDPDVRACMLCKGKVIKGAQMSKVHKASTAHARRFERFKRLSANSDQQSDAWQLARTIQKGAFSLTGAQNRPDAARGLSKRALKRSAKQASITGRRLLHRKLRAEHSAKKAAQSQSTAAAPHSTGAAADDRKIIKKRRQKAAPPEVEKSPLALQKPPKRRKDHTVTSALSTRTPPRKHERPLVNPKTEKVEKRPKAA